MLSENWKILLDYNSECNAVTKHCLNRAWVLLFWEVKLFHIDLWQTTSTFTRKLYMRTTRQWEIQNSKFWRHSTLFSADFLRAQNMVWVIEGKISHKWSEGKQKLLRVSGRFELSRVQVTKGNITVNVWRKTREKSILVRISARFELVRVRVIESQP